MESRAPIPVYKPTYGTCDECGTERVRLIDRPKPGDVGPRRVCAVCDSKSPPLQSSPS